MAIHNFITAEILQVIYLKIIQAERGHIWHDTPKVFVFGNIVYNNIWYALYGTFSWVALMWLNATKCNYDTQSLEQSSNYFIFESVSRSK